MMEKLGLTEVEEKRLQEFEATKQPEMSDDELHSTISAAMKGAVFAYELPKLRTLVGDAASIAEANEKRCMLLGLICYNALGAQECDGEIKLINLIQYADTWEHFREKDLLGYPIVLRAMAAFELAVNEKHPELVLELNRLIGLFVEATGDGYRLNTHSEIAYALAMSFDDDKFNDLDVQLDCLLSRYVEAVSAELAVEIH